MIELLHSAEARGAGLVHARDLAELGLNPRHIRGALSRGMLVRVARGAYAIPPHDRQHWPSELHALRVRATLPLASPNSIASHLSAAALHDLPLIGSWPTSVHTTVPGARGGSSSKGIIRHTSAQQVAAVRQHGVSVTSIARTIVDVAATQSLLIAVTMCDSALHRRLVTIDELADELLAIGRSRGRRRAADCLAFADGLAESPGESATRVNAWQLGYELPQLQIPVATRRGNYSVDLGWESARLFGEFDGKVKYTRDSMMKGKTIDAVVFEEKQREDAIRAATDRSFVRLLWREVLNVRVLNAILSDAGVPRRIRTV